MHPDHQYKWFDLLFGFCFLSGALGLVIGTVVAILGGPFAVGFVISTPIAFLLIGKLALQVYRVRAEMRAKFIAPYRQEWERQQQHERLRPVYAEKYQAYLPKWQAWSKALILYEAEVKHYENWKQEKDEWWQDYRTRARAAANEFERLHANVVKRAHLELELRDAEHIDKLFAEVIKKSGRRLPDLGFLREVGRFVENDTPELAYLTTDKRLQAVRHLLPPLPIFSEVSLENHRPPIRPKRPEPPEGVIFYVPQYGTDDTLPPVPPDKVKWS